MEEIDRANASPLPTLGTGPSQLADTAGAPNDWGCSGDGNDLILHFPAGLFPEQLANGALVGARGEDLHGPPPCGIAALNSSPVDHRVNACAPSPKLRAASPPLSDVLRARPRRAHRQRWLGQRVDRRRMLTHTVTQYQHVSAPIGVESARRSTISTEAFVFNPAIDMQAAVRGGLGACPSDGADGRAGQA